MRNYPDFLQAFMDYTEFVEAPEVFLKWSALSVIAGALERKVWINFKNFMHCYPNLYVMLIGPPGLVKKSTSSGLAVNLIKPLEHLEFLGSQMTAAAFVEDIRKSGVNRHVEFEGKQYNNSSVYLYSSEAATTLNEVQGSIIELLTDFYDCQPNGWYTQEEGNCWKKSLKGEGLTRIFNPCVNMLACSTPVWLVESIGRENLESGFASRIIFVVHSTRTKRSFEWGEETPDTTGMRKKLTEDLDHISRIQGEYVTTACFKQTFNKFDERGKKFLEQNPSDVLIGYHARKSWHALKISQVLKAAKSDEPILTGVDLAAALELLEEIEPEMYKIFDSIDRPEETRHLIEIFDYLRKADLPLSKSQISARFLNKDQNVITAVLGRLVTLKRLSVASAPGVGVIYTVEDKEPLFT